MAGSRTPSRDRGRAERSPAGEGTTVSARELQILRTIAEALGGASDVDAALQTTLEQVAELLGLHAGWIWLTDPETGRFYAASARRLPPFLREPVRMTGRTCWCLDAFRDGELSAGNIDVMECSRLRAAVAARDRARTRGLRYHASIPLYFGDRPLGIMNVAAPAWRKLTKRELDLLSTIASQVGVAIERARLADASVHLARVEERSRLARELHDTLAQQLTAIGLHLEAALDALPRTTAAQAAAGEPGASNAPRTRTARMAARHDAGERALSQSLERELGVPLRRALELSRTGLDQARRSMRQLRTPAARPLPEALDALARAFIADTGIRVHVRTTGRSALTATEEEELLRIASEALTNVRKHARATEVTLSLVTRGRTLRLELADDGQGFNPRAKPSPGSFGLLGMRERAQALGGRLHITSRPRHGTRIAVTMRVPEPEPVPAPPSVR